MNNHEWKLISGDENEPRSIFIYRCAYCEKRIRCVPGILSRPKPPGAHQGYPCIRNFPSYATLPTTLVGCTP
jgi:hypothetical protein